MNDDVEVWVQRKALPKGVELTLTAKDGSDRCWSKRYDGDVFMGMDCLDLDLLEQRPRLHEDSVVKHQTFLKTTGRVSVGRLLHLRFQESATK